jgi:transcriptional regulator of acetoin/glycerol metabolism
MVKPPSTLPIGPDDPEAEAPHAFLIRAVDGRLRSPAPLVLELGELDEVVLARGERLEAIVEARRAIVHVDDPSLSARHARIVRADPASFSLEDLGSTNGCRVNGVPAAGSHPLAGGDLLETGTSFWKLHLGPVAHRERLLELAYRSGPIEFASSVCFAMLEALWRVRQVAPTELSVLLLGESGTGKEGLARELHLRSGRGGPFVALNCAAVPEELIESELFGHHRGAFSGAVTDKPGLIESAEGGTLLLDEIGDMPPALQAKLLRVLQERSFLRLGETSPRRANVRFVAATHRDLKQMVASGGFRGDLYARLKGLVVRLPPLRERKEDLGILLAALLERQAAPPLSITQDALRALVLHDWPFNIRELEQALALAVTFARDEGELRLAHLPAELCEVRAPAAPTVTGPRRPRGAPSREELLALLAEHGGNISAVARELDTTRMQIHRWLKRLAIDPGSLRG